MQRSYLPFFLGILLPLASAQAQTAVHASDKASLGLLLQDTDYETDESFDVEGQLLIGAYKKAIDPRLSFGGGLGLMLDGEIGTGTQVDGGEGFRLFLEGQYAFGNWNGNQIVGLANLTHDRFSFDGARTDIDFQVTELKFSGLLLRKVRDFTLHGGLEAVIFSDGSYEVGNFNGDVERDDRINIRLGASFMVDSLLDIRADLLLFGEQSMLFAADYKI